MALGPFSKCVKMTYGVGKAADFPQLFNSLMRVGESSGPWICISLRILVPNSLILVEKILLPSVEVSSRSESASSSLISPPQATAKE